MKQAASEDITEIFQCNMLDRYLDRPDESFKNGMYREISNMCFSEFLSLFTQNQGQQKIWKMITGPCSFQDLTYKS